MLNNKFNIYLHPIASGCRNILSLVQINEIENFTYLKQKPSLCIKNFNFPNKHSALTRNVFRGK